MVKSVKKALDILTILSENADKPIPLKELALRTGLNKSTCAHIVDTMCEQQYVERISSKEGYRLGPWSYMLSRYGTYCQNLVSTSSSILKWLHKQTEATVFLSVLCNGRKYIVYHIESDNILPMGDGSMIQGHVESTATGRVMLAYMNQTALNHLLKKDLKAQDDGLGTEMEEALARIRACGYAHLAVESENQQSYAFRITKDTKTVASMGVLYRNTKDSPSYREKVVKLGTAAAREISHRLEFM